MSALKTFQEQLKNVLVRNDPQATAALWGQTPPDRLHVYKNNIHSNWTDALDHDFPLTRQQFDDADWDQLRQKFFAKHPPKHWELNTAIGPFIPFLGAQKLKKHVKELADYEWQDLSIFVDRSAVRRKSGLSNPTARVSVYQHQIFNWVESGALADKPPEQKPEVLIFYRDSKNTCHIREADPLMLLMLEHFRKPNAPLDDLEPARQRLLPGNTVPLQNVLNALRADDLIL